MTYKELEVSISLRGGVHRVIEVKGDGKIISLLDFTAADLEKLASGARRVYAMRSTLYEIAPDDERTSSDLALDEDRGEYAASAVRQIRYRKLGEPVIR